jgi:hypothetical protein
MFAQRGHQRGAVQWTPLPGATSITGNRLLVTTHTPTEPDARHAEGIWLLEQKGDLMGKPRQEEGGGVTSEEMAELAPSTSPLKKPSQFGAYFARAGAATGANHTQLPASASLNAAPPLLQPTPPPESLEPVAPPVETPPAPPEPEPEVELLPPSVVNYPAPAPEIEPPEPEPDAEEAARGEDTTLYISWGNDGLSAEVHAVLGSRAQRNADKVHAALKRFWSEDGVHARLLDEPTATEVKIALEAAPGRQAKFFLTLGNLVDVLTQRHDPEAVILTESREL